MTCEFPCAPGRDNNVQCECLFLNEGDYSASRSNQIAGVIAGLDPAIHLFRKKMDARVKPAHEAERTAGGVKSRDIRGPIAGSKNPLTDDIRSEAGLPANIFACHSGRASRASPGEGEPEYSNQSGLGIYAGRRLLGPGSREPG